MRAQRLEMRLRLGVQRPEHGRRAGDQPLHLGVLAVENAQRVAVQAPPAVLVERRLVRAEIRDQLLAVGRANRRRAERIHQELDARQSEPAQEPRRQQNDFRIDVRPLESERLGVDLVELTVASRLRPLAPEHRAHAPHAQAPLAQQAVRDHRARDPRGRLGTQSDVILALIDEAEHLLLDDVGEVADRALEQLRLLDDGYAEFLVAVACEHLACDPLQVLPGRDVRGQDVVNATQRLDDLGQGKLRSAAR